MYIFVGFCWVGVWAWVLGFRLAASASGGFGVWWWSVFMVMALVGMDWIGLDWVGMDW